MTTDIWLSVIADMQARRELGIAQYGVPVDATRNDDWAQHAYEEVLDITVYLRAALERRDTVRREIGAVLWHLEACAKDGPVHHPGYYAMLADRLRELGFVAQASKEETT